MAPEVCGQIMTFDLFAGNVPQDVVGYVNVSNNDEYLFVEIYAGNNESFTDSHLNISCTMPDAKGSPGNYNANDFLVTNESNETYQKYAVPKSFIDGLDCANDCFYLLVHVATGKGETAYGGGCGEGNGYVSGPGAWFNYICYCWQECCQASGKVEKQLCEGNAEPVAGVTVYFKQGETERNTTTDETGFYEFKNIGTGNYKIWVDNYLFASPVPAKYEGNCPTVPDNTNLNFDYYFYSITGDVDKLVCEVPVTGEFTVALSGGPTTKAPVVTEGYFEFKWLAAGTYTVSVAGTTPQEFTLPGEPDVCVDDVQFTINKYDLMGYLKVLDCEEPIAPIGYQYLKLYSNDVYVTDYTTDMNGKFMFSELNLSGPFEIRFNYLGKDYTYPVTSCEENTITIEIPCIETCYKDETAWSEGSRYVTRGSWATYTSFAGIEKTVNLYAGQSMLAGSVTFKPVTGGVEVKIDLADGWVFADVPENIKIQGYMTAPTKNPDIGSFANKANASLTDRSYTIFIDNYNFYGVHVDLWKIVPCPPTPQ